LPILANRGWGLEPIPTTVTEQLCIGMIKIIVKSRTFTVLRGELPNLYFAELRCKFFNYVPVHSKEKKYE
jgi:hypothetical protein